jgi:hypothetical protein
MYMGDTADDFTLTEPEQGPPPEEPAVQLETLTTMMTSMMMQ